MPAPGQTTIHITRSRSKTWPPSFPRSRYLIPPRVSHGIAASLPRLDAGPGLAAGRRPRPRQSAHQSGRCRTQPKNTRWRSYAGSRRGRGTKDPRSWGRAPTPRGPRCIRPRESERQQSPKAPSHSSGRRPGAMSQSSTMTTGPMTCRISFDQPTVAPCGSSMPRSSKLYTTPVVAMYVVAPARKIVQPWESLLRDESVNMPTNSARAAKNIGFHGEEREEVLDHESDFALACAFVLDRPLNLGNQCSHNGNGTANAKQVGQSPSHKGNYLSGYSPQPNLRTQRTIGMTLRHALTFT